MTGDRTPLRERLVETLIAHARRGTHEKEIKLSAFMGAVIRTGAESRADALLPVVEAETAALRASLDRAHQMAAEYSKRGIENGERADNAEDRLRKAEQAYAQLAERHADAEATCDRWRKRAEETERQRDDALAALTRHAAEAHRRKWAHEDGNQAAFDALHRLGDEILASRDRLLAALEPPKETP